VSGPAYAHHDYSPRPTGHPASQVDRFCEEKRGSTMERKEKQDKLVGLITFSVYEFLFFSI
jgi:hypothetical protein